MCKKFQNFLYALEHTKVAILLLHACSAFGKLTWKVTEEKKARGGGGGGGAGQVHPHSSRLNTAILKSTKKIRLDLENPDDVLGLG